MKDFDDVVDFTIVYIEEAHPIEGWRIRVRSFDSLSLYRNGLNTKGVFKVSAGLFRSSLQTVVTSRALNKFLPGRGDSHIKVSGMLFVLL